MQGSGRWERRSVLAAAWHSEQLRSHRSSPSQEPRSPFRNQLVGGDQQHCASPAALLQQQSSDSEILDVLKIVLQKLQAQPGAQRAAFTLIASERGKPPRPTPCTLLGGKRGTRRGGAQSAAPRDGWARQNAALPLMRRGAELRSPRVYFCARRKEGGGGVGCAQQVPAAMAGQFGVQGVKSKRHIRSAPSPPPLG